MGSFEVCVLTHVALRMFIMQVLASKLHFLANRNAELAVPPLFWPVNCMKIGEHVALLTCPSICFLFYANICQRFIFETFNLVYSFQLVGIGNILTFTSS